MSNVFTKLKWYWFTRLLGTTIILYELFGAAGSPERGTIILVGAGILGYDFVVHRSDKEIEINHRSNRPEEHDE